MSGARRLTIPSSGAIQNSGRVLMWMRPGSYSREKLSNVSRRRYQLEHTLLQLKVSNQKAPSVGLPSLSTFTEEMKAARFLVTMLVVVVQILLFVLAWDWFVDVARNAGREQRGGVGFGIFVYYGVFLIGCAFAVGSTVSAITSSSLTRWLTIGLLAGVWSLYAWPPSNYPIRGSVFYILGFLILVIGSGIITPLLNRGIHRALSPKNKLTTSKAEVATRRKPSD